MDDPFLARSLADHGSFVRALAHGLLRDAHEAEDVAQETWVRFLERPPSLGGSLRHWFRTVARNAARNALRGAKRRRAREERSARAEALPSTADELVRVDLLRTLIDAVLALDEPYRSTILARYYRGWSSARIAEETGTPLTTVRSREQRALELLRQKLGRTFEGGRADWALALGRVLALEPAAGAPGGAERAGTGVASQAALAGAAVIVALVAWRVLAPDASSSPGAPSAASAATTSSVALEDPPPALSELPEILPAREPVLVQRDVESSAASSDEEGSSSGSQALLVDATSEVRGRLVHSDASPAEGVALALELGGEIVRAGVDASVAEPEDWEDRQAASDSDGRFSFTFVKPADRELRLIATAPGFARAAWDWDDIRPGMVVDLGEVAWLRAATVTGRLVDANGDPIVGQEWSIQVRSVGLADPAGRDESRVGASVDPATGSFDVEGVTPGTNVLDARSDLAGWVAGPRVQLAEEESAAVDFAYAGPDTSRRIKVDVSMERYHSVPAPAPEHIRLIAPDGTLRTSRFIERSATSFAFDDLAPGSYTLDVDDPRCLPWSRAGVEPGSRIHAELVGSAGLVLHVVDGSSGATVAADEVVVELREVNFFPNAFELRGPALASDTLGGLFPGDYTIRARAGELFGSSTTDALAPGETRALTVPLRPELSVAGVVRYTDGAPVAHADVVLLRPAAVDDSSASPILALIHFSSGDVGHWRSTAAQGETAADGSFRLTVPTEGTYFVHVKGLAGSEVFSSALTLADGSVDGLALALARPGSVSGRVHAPNGCATAGLRVWFLPTSLGTHRADALVDQTSATLAADGSYSVASVAAGNARAFLLLPRYLQHQGGVGGGGLTWSSDTLLGASELGQVDVPAGGALARDFTFAECPGSLELAVRVNGAPAPRLSLRLTRDDALDSLEVETDDHGTFGPARVFAGVWSIQATDTRTGWSQQAPDPLVIAAGQTTIAEIALQRP